MSNLLFLSNWLSERNIEHQIVKGKIDILHIKEDIGRRLDPVLEGQKALFKRANRNVFVSLTEDVEEFEDYIERCVEETQTTQSDPLDAILNERRATATRLTGALNEALNGMAAEFQPPELLSSLKRAMEKLQLIQKLKEAGVTATVSRDKQFVTFIKKAGGERIQIMQIATEQLSEPRFMTTLLNNLMDVADGKAPGCGENQRNVIKNREKKINQIAKQFVVQQRDEQLR